MKITTKDYQIDLTIEELKELLIDKSNARTPSVGSSDISTVKPKVSHNSTRKISLDTIKQIKELAENGMNNKDIAKRLNVSPQLVNYWRKNTPKDINV